MLFNEVKRTILDVIDVDESKIRPGASLAEDLGADSLDRAEIVIAIEEKFNIDIPCKEAVKIRTIENIIAAIEKQIKENG